MSADTHRGETLLLFSMLGEIHSEPPSFKTQRHSWRGGFYGTWMGPTHSQVADSLTQVSNKLESLYDCFFMDFFFGWFLWILSEEPASDFEVWSPRLVRTSGTLASSLFVLIISSINTEAKASYSVYQSKHWYSCFFRFENDAFPCRSLKLT